jgi:hypothetical protein
LSKRPAPVEYEDVFSTFDKKTRENSQEALRGFGDAFAGRGESINEAIRALNPFFVHLTPVMQNLSAPDTRLQDFFKNIGRASAQVAPVAKAQSDSFQQMATTLEAFSDCESCLEQTIQKSPGTLQSGIDSFRVQRPFLRDFAAVSRSLRPVATTLKAKLPVINSALETGTPVLRRTPKLNELTGELLQSIDDLVQKPETLLALQDLHGTLVVARPLFEYVSPYQSVCGTASSFFTGLSSHLSNGVTNGTSQNIQVKTGSNEQDHKFNSSEGERPADIPSNIDPQNYFDTAGDHYQIAMLTPYAPAVDSQGNADCQNGQYGYWNGPLNPAGAPYHPTPLGNGESFADWENRAGGGSHTVYDSDVPGLLGPTYVAKRLGINGLKDVP